MVQFQSPIYGSRTLFWRHPEPPPTGFNPLSTGHAPPRPRLPCLRTLCFNPLSTGHARPLLLLDEPFSQRFNPLSTGHARIGRNNTRCSRPGFNPLSTGHARQDLAPTPFAVE